MKTKVILIILVACLCLSWTGRLGASDETFIITSGSTLNVLVYKDEELSRDYLVDAGGYIDMPLIGKVEVGNLTVPEATDRIEAKLKKFIREPQVNIYATGYGNVYVLGEVVTPGPYQLSGKMSVLDAIGMAGGLKPTASKNRIRVIRKTNGEGSRVIKVKLGKVLKGDMSADVLLKPGDVINVPERIF